MPRATYINTTHAQAAVRTLLLGAGIILSAEKNLTLAEALNRASAAGEGDPEALKQTLAYLTQTRNGGFCPDQSLAELCGSHARELVRKALKEQGVTFCKPFFEPDALP